MSEPKVIFDGVWKKFLRGERHDSLRDLFPSMMKRLTTRRDKNELGDREFWVLRDVSFTVDTGQALGIIGPNGAGKSTTLKLLTKILRADRGRVAVHGRIGALIEIAAGFHPDLTGRENVYLQGAIMGMRRTEIARKFDEIVEFAGVSAFIDTPVKRYSSGMNARLGFAIAAHLEPDVLIIDEVLSVGDFKFQNRAFNKISELVQRETPVVVVSHQLDQIAALCSHAILLDRGRIVESGTPNACIRRYLTQGSDPSDTTNEPVRFTSMTLEPDGPYLPGQTVTLRLRGETLPSWKPASEYIAIRMMTQAGLKIFTTGVDRLQIDVPPQSPFEIEVALDLNLAGGAYMLDAIVWEYHEQRQVVGGPVLLVQVADDLAQTGQVYLNPRGRLSVTPPAPAAVS
jgi:ABC-type polysaccharide/polyol phosphate transport system ATPase subunit